MHLFHFYFGKALLNIVGDVRISSFYAKTKLATQFAFKLQFQSVYTLPFLMCKETAHEKLLKKATTAAEQKQ